MLEGARNNESNRIAATRNDSRPLTRKALGIQGAEPCLPQVLPPSTMNILMIAENDPAGMAIAFTQAINAYSNHHCRLITTRIRYNFEFEKDLHVPELGRDGFDEIVSLLARADMIHFHVLADENMTLGPIRLRDHIRGKAILHHHHGHPDFRNNPQKYRDKYHQKIRKFLVSTPDLLQIAPEALWQPNLVPIEAPLYRPCDTRINGNIRICQAPTRKDLKNTDQFERVVDALQPQYPKLTKVLIEGNAHAICLNKKQACQIHFDHMQGYFGVSSLEGLSQGKPVIAGLDEWNMLCIQRFTGTENVPWVIARNGDELKNAIARLVEDEDERYETGKKSRRFMQNCWTERQVLKQLFSVYESI